MLPSRGAKNINGAAKVLGRKLAVKRVVLILAVIFAAWGGSPAAAETSPGEAKAFIAGLSGEALKVLRADGVKLGDKEERVRALLAENIDLDAIGRFVLGRALRRASAEHRDQFQALFREFVLRTYARRLGGYNGQTFDVAGARPLGKRDVLVDTRISRPSGPPIELGWRVRNGPDGYKILDVVISGVSMAVTQRSEFRSVLSKRGMEGLIELLRVQVSKLAAASRPTPGASSAAKH